MAKSEAMVFTVFDYTDEDYERIKGIDCLCIIMQKEVCPETHRDHIQGYIEWKSRTTFEKAHRLIYGSAKGDNNKTTAWIKKAEGSYEDNKKYCTKQGGRDAFEKGVGKKKGQGSRTDLAVAAEMIKDGAGMREVAQEHPTTFIRNFKGLAAYQYVLTPDRVDAPKLYYVFGESGVGKSRSIREFHTSEKVFTKTDDGKPWMDGLTPRHEVLVLDEFTGKTPIPEINRWCDYGPCQCEIKGGYVKLNVKFVYIVSNFSLEDVYRNKAPQEYAPLIRRIREFGDTIEVKKAADGKFINFIEKYNNDKAAAMAVDDDEPQVIAVVNNVIDDIVGDNNVDYEAPGQVYPPPTPQPGWEPEPELPDTQPMPAEAADSQVDPLWGW